MPEPVWPTRFLSVLDFEAEALEACLALAARLKQTRHAGRGSRAQTGSSGSRLERGFRLQPEDQPLTGLHIALLFDKPSLRTRSTFQIAVRELGGDVIEPPADVSLGGRETVADVARNLERWVAGAVIRTFAQQRVVEFAAAAPRLRVVNALTDEEHPCQALADYLTLQEKWGTLRGKTLTFVGDGNNVATSLAHAGAMLGVHVRVASPAGFDLPRPVVEAARSVARLGATIEILRDPVEAVRGADAVYTDVWASMGQESEAAARRAAFEAYQVNAALMAAAPGALFMHCLPAHRGDEVTDEVLDSPASIVFDQAENRLHTQKALLAMLFAGRD
jgi:ornithine carbamoyltransferase